MLAGFGVDAVQGFHVGTPEPAYDVEALHLPDETAPERTDGPVSEPA